MRAARWVNSVAAALVALTITVLAPTHAAHADDAWVYPSRLDDGQTAPRLDRCRLGFVLQAGGPEIKKVAQTGLTGTDAQMHTAADPSYWNTTPLTHVDATRFVQALGPDDVAVMISAKSRTPLDVRRAPLSTIQPSDPVRAWPPSARVGGELV